MQLLVLCLTSRALGGKQKKYQQQLLARQHENTMLSRLLTAIGVRLNVLHDLRLVHRALALAVLLTCLLAASSCSFSPTVFNCYKVAHRSSLKR